MADKNVTRRDFVRTAAVAAGVGVVQPRPEPSARRAMSREDMFTENREVELNTTTLLGVYNVKPVEDPYNMFDVDFDVTAPDGSTYVLPGIGGNYGWITRFSPSQLGHYRLVSRSNAPEEIGLNGKAFTVHATPYTGNNPLYRHGRLRVAANKRHLEHSDGTPFLWVGDTWWMSLCARLDDEGFATLLQDRKEKGFSVIQIIAGPYPDMDTWDPRGRSTAGFPFEQDFSRVNSDYYDVAEARLSQIVEAGLVPCIVGMWGYYLPRIGVERAKRFWRNLVARFGGYPVVWCICGEATMPYYLSETKEQDAVVQKSGWTEVMRQVRSMDPYRNPITIHPTQFGHEQVEDPSLMDVNMLQTGHNDIDSIPNVIKCVREACAHEPAMPVVNGEVNYEGIMGRCWHNIIRLAFYHSMLNGAAGFTYGANGIWQVNQPDKPYGPSPHGRSWGNMPWPEAMNLPGSREVGIGGRFLARYPWWDLQRQPEWYTESQKENDPYGPIVVGIPRRLRIAYSPMCWNPPTIKGIEPDVRYTASYFDPVTGAEIALGPVSPDAEGSWTPPFPPEVHDWLIVLNAA